MMTDMAVEIASRPQSGACPGAITARKATIRAISMTVKIGIINSQGVIGIWYQINIPANTSPAARKSTKRAPTCEMTITSRGKYVLVTTLRWLTSPMVAVVNALERNVHGTSATYEKIGYGRPSEGSRANRPNTRLKTTMNASGWRI